MRTIRHKSAYPTLKLRTSAARWFLSSRRISMPQHQSCLDFCRETGSIFNMIYFVYFLGFSSIFITLIEKSKILFGIHKLSHDVRMNSLMKNDEHCSPSNEEEQYVDSLADHKHLSNISFVPEIDLQWTSISNTYDHQAQLQSTTDESSSHFLKLENSKEARPYNFHTSTDGSRCGNSSELVSTSPYSSNSFESSIGVQEFNDLEVLASSGFGQTLVHSPSDIQTSVYGWTSYESPKMSPYLLAGSSDPEGAEPLPPSGKKPRLPPRLPSSQHSKSKQVRKERLSDRVSALQQLVAPFGKTDTASVLTEAFGYIKFLQEQIQTLSMPYFRSSRQLIRTTQEVSGDGEEAIGQDLISKGLCLVPIACTHFFTGESGSVWAPAHFRGN